MSDNHEHHHTLTIDPKELNSGSILASVNLNEADSISISTNRMSLYTAGHDGDEGVPKMLSPIELILASLARSTIQILHLAIEVNNFEISKLHVAVSQTRENNEMLITREIIIEGDASDEEREVLKKMIEGCPVQKILKSGASVETVIA